MKKELFTITRQTSIKQIPIDSLRKFITEQGKILPRHASSISAKKHRLITKFIKKARILGYLPFTNKRGS